MQVVYIELVEAGVVVFRPGTEVVVAILPSREAAITYARAEWPGLGIRAVVTKSIRKLYRELPLKCVHCS